MSLFIVPLGNTLKINGKAVLGPVEPKWAVDYALARAKIQYFVSPFLVPKFNWLIFAFHSTSEISIYYAVILFNNALTWNNTIMFIRPYIALMI